MPTLPIDLTPLLRGARGDELPVAGVRAGGPASDVDRAVLTGAEEDEPGEPRTYANGTVYRKDAAGALVEIPLAERVEVALHRGGWLRQGEVSLSVEGGVVARIFVRGPSLAALGLKQEADIERTFGPAEGRERRFGTHHFHYGSRGVVFGWHSKERRLEHIALGPDPWREPRLGAPALLAELLGVACTPAPDTGIWRRLLKASPTEPRSVRVRRARVAALCRALDLGAPEEVMEGTFLPRVLDPGRQRVLDELAAQAPVPGMKRFAEARLVYTHLLRYRRDAEGVIRATSGWMECSDPALIGMIAAQNRIGEQVTLLMTDVDRWLCALLDPDGRTFSVSELIASYGWPDVDLGEVEMEEW